MIQSQAEESDPDSTVNIQDFTGSGGEREDRELMDHQIKGLVILGKKKKANASL